MLDRILVEIDVTKEIPNSLSIIDPNGHVIKQKVMIGYSTFVKSVNLLDTIVILNLDPPKFRQNHNINGLGK